MMIQAAPPVTIAERNLRQVVTAATVLATLLLFVAFTLFAVQAFTENNVEVPVTAVGATGQLCAGLLLLVVRLLAVRALRAYLTEKAATQGRRR